MKKHLYLTQVLRKVLDPNPEFTTLVVFGVTRNYYDALRQAWWCPMSLSDLVITHSSDGWCLFDPKPLSKPVMTYPKLDRHSSFYPSVRPSACHTFLIMFLSSYHPEIFRRYYHWQTCKRSRSEIKGQGHRGHDPTYPFPDCNSSFNSHTAMKWCTKLDVV